MELEPIPSAALAAMGWAEIWRDPGPALPGGWGGGGGGAKDSSYIPESWNALSLSPWFLARTRY